MIGAPTINKSVFSSQTRMIAQTGAVLHRRRPFQSLAPWLSGLALLAPCIAWALLDQSVWRWDEAWYGEVTVELYDTLKHAPRDWPAALCRAMAVKPPGLMWLGQFFVPLGQKIGSIDLGLRIPILLFHFITLLLIYRIGRELSPTRSASIGLAGCALAGAAPLFIGMSHYYLAEPLQMMVTAWLFYCAVFSPRWGRLRILGHLTTATAVALLSKTTTPIFCLLPGLMAAAPTLRRRPATTDGTGALAFASRLGFLVFGAGLLAATALWYITNWHEVRQHVYIASVSDISLQYGRQMAFVPKFAFWLTALQEGMFLTPMFSCMATALTLFGVVAWASRRRRPQHGPTAVNPVALLAGLQIVMVLAAFACTIPEDTRYLTAAIPAVVIVLMWALAQLRSRRMVFLFAALAVAQWGYIHLLTLGFRDYLSPSAPPAKAAHCILPATPDLSDWKSRFWLLTPERDPSYLDDTTRVVQLTSSAGATANRYNVVGIELPWCNSNSYAFHAAKNKLLVGRRAYFTSLGYAEKDLNAALKRIDDLNTAYFISLEEERQPRPPSFLNLIAAPALARIEADNRFERVPFPSRLGLVVFKRIRR